MFRALKQIAVLIIFLMLTIFSSVYFQDEKNTEESGQHGVVVDWIVKTVKGSGKTLVNISSLVNLANPSIGLEDSINVKDMKTEGADNFLSEKTKLEEKYLEKTEFNQFLADFLYKVPAIYFDAKIYSNSWRNLWSSVTNGDYESMGL